MINVTYYQRPNGKAIPIQCRNITDEDSAFFNDNGFRVSMEDLLTGQIVIYSTTGLKDEDGNDDEVCYPVPDGQSCEEAMSILRKRVESYLQS